MPDPGNPLDWDRYAYARNNPQKYVDPNGHFQIDIILDIVFLAYDAGAILIEGPTPVNMAALAADADCALIPYGTGGGLALRLGGEAVIQGVTTLPAGIRALQTTEKLIQFADNSSDDDIAKGITNLTNDASKFGGPNGLIGKDFENWLTKKLGGTGSFKVGGREFDNAVGNRWIEAKSGGYWDKFDFQKFTSDMGDHLRIAVENHKTLELHSNSPIPQYVKDWLTEHGILFYEY